MGQRKKRMDPVEKHPVKEVLEINTAAKEEALENSKHMIKFDTHASGINALLAMANSLPTYHIWWEGTSKQYTVIPSD
jgi:hypothetical protein